MTFKIGDKVRCVKKFDVVDKLPYLLMINSQKVLAFSTVEKALEEAKKYPGPVYVSKITHRVESKITGYV